MDLYEALHSLIDSDKLPGSWLLSKLWAFRDVRDKAKFFAVVRNVEDPDLRLEFVLAFRGSGYRCVRARLMHRNRLKLYKEVIL